MHDASHSLRRRIAGAAAATLAALAVAAPAAQADSIAYIKDGNVFLSTTDGARFYQVTFDGGYSTVSQADSGRMVALRGDKLRHLERDGRVIAEIATPVSTTNDPSMSFKGPFDPEISPDGRKVAYTYYWQYTGYDPYCNPSNGCYVKRLYHGTGFTDPNRLTAWDEPGFLRRSGWIDAAWVDNSTVLLSDPYIQPNEDTVLWSPDDAASLRRWFQDPGYPGDVAEATISRDRSAMATITSSGAGMSILRSVGGFYPNYPNRCYEAAIEEAGDQLSSPTLNADGSRIYWASLKEGVHAATLPRFTADSCGTLTDSGRLLIAGASSPSWGPADVPAPRTTTPPPPGPDTDPATDAGTTPPPANTPGVVPAPAQPTGPASTPLVKLTITRAKLAVALRKGLTLRVTGARSGRHAIVVRFGKTTVAKGTATVGSGGGGRVTLRFSQAGKRKLAKRKSATLRITGAGARASVTLKR
jgi:hypothetical protein